MALIFSRYNHSNLLLIGFAGRYNYSNLLLIGLASDLERLQEVEQHNPQVLANERVEKKSGNLQLVHFGSV